MGSRWRRKLLRSMDTRTSALCLASLVSWKGERREGRKHDYLVLLPSRYLFLRLFRNCIHCLYWRILRLFPSHTLSASLIVSIAVAAPSHSSGSTRFQSGFTELTGAYSDGKGVRYQERYSLYLFQSKRH